MRDNRSSRKFGKCSSGTVVNDTLFKPNLTRLLSRPKNALSMTFSSSLLDRSSEERRGNVAKAASSKRKRKLFERFKLERDYREVIMSMIDD